MPAGVSTIRRLTRSSRPVAFCRHSGRLNVDVSTHRDPCLQSIMQSSPGGRRLIGFTAGDRPPARSRRPPSIYGQLSRSGAPRISRQPPLSGSRASVSRNPNDVGLNVGRRTAATLPGTEQNVRDVCRPCDTRPSISHSIIDGTNAGMCNVSQHSDRALCKRRSDDTLSIVAGKSGLKICSLFKF